MQKIVRTYPYGYTNETRELSIALKDGYTVVMVNKITGKCECLEYILEKK